VWRPFGELLTDMERKGIRVDVPLLKDIVPVASAEKQKHEQRFIDWAASRCPDAKFMNPGSDPQKQQLFFAPCSNLKTGKKMPEEREFSTENVDGFIEPGKTKALKTRSFKLKGLALPFKETTNNGWPAVSQDVLQKLAGDPPNRYQLTELAEVNVPTHHLRSSLQVGRASQLLQMARLEGWGRGLLCRRFCRGIFQN